MLGMSSSLLQNQYLIQLLATVRGKILKGENWQNWRIVNHSPIFYLPIISVLEIQEIIS